MQKRHRLTGNGALNKMICTQIALEPGGYPCIGKPLFSPQQNRFNLSIFHRQFCNRHRYFIAVGK